MDSLIESLSNEFLNILTSLIMQEIVSVEKYEAILNAFFCYFSFTNKDVYFNLIKRKVRDGKLESAVCQNHPNFRQDPTDIPNKQLLAFCKHYTYYISNIHFFQIFILYFWFLETTRQLKVEHFQCKHIRGV
jgi:hypothetical protein